MPYALVSDMNVKEMEMSDLVSTLRGIAAEEHRLNLVCLEVLREVERRRGYADMGYSSLYEFCVKELGFSEGSAYRRISAMRLTKEVPGAKQAIEQGRISLSSASVFHTFLREEKKKDREYSDEEKQSLLAQLEGKSRRESERVLTAVSPLAFRGERVRFLDDTHVELRVVLDERQMSKLQRLRELLAHRLPNSGYAELFEAIADVAIAELDPLAGGAELAAEGNEQASMNELEQNPLNDDAPRATSPATKRSVTGGGRKRHIPQALRKAVWFRDRGICTYVDPKSGRRCGSRFALEVDHIEPYGLGGHSKIENLRLLCRTHNQLMAMRAYGPEKISEYVPDLK